MVEGMMGEREPWEYSSETTALDHRHPGPGEFDVLAGIIGRLTLDSQSKRGRTGPDYPHLPELSTL